MCDTGWKLFGESCYKIASVIRSWSDAKSDCESQTAHLLKIDDRDEQSYFNILLRKMDSVGKTNNCNRSNKVKI